MSDGGKGSRPRPFSVTLDEFDNRWDAIFKKENKMQVRVPEEGKKIGTCGCGRSPTGDCCGWHALTEEQYQAKLQEFKNQIKSLEE